MRFLRVLGLFVVVLAPLATSLAACSSTPDADPDAPPPRVCKTPSAPAGAWFSEATAEVGLAKTDSLEPLANGIVAADLDGDGYPDLLAQLYPSTRGPVGGKQARFVFMNRKAPDGSRVFVEATKESGLLATRDGAGDRGYGLANLGDVDNDGDVDVLLCPPDSDVANVKDPCDVFFNDGKGKFTLGPESDLDKSVFWVSSGALVDFDRDGILDFWPGTVGNWGGGVPTVGPKLFHGNGDGTFQDVAAAYGLPTVNGSRKTGASFRRTFGVVACDLDGDGDDDVVLADYGREEDQVWRNDGDHFTNVAHEWGLDYDPRQDYTDNQSYLCFCQNNPGSCPEPNLPAPEKGICAGFGDPQANGRGWTQGVDDQPYRLGGNTFSHACGDVDNDGDLDLMTATIVHGDVGSSSDPSELIFNPGNGGKWEHRGNDKTGLLRKHDGIFWNDGDMMPVFADFDLDGRPDIYLTSSDYPGDTQGWLWHQKADGTFEEITKVAGVFQESVQGIAVVDIDGDGDLDILTGTSTFRASAPTQAIHVYRNGIGAASNFLRVRLEGKGAGFANRSAIGARVRVTAGGKTQTQELQGGYGHNNVENDLVLTFGLGTSCDAEKIEVRWPDGTSSTSTFTGVQANVTVRLVQGDGKVHYVAR